MIISITCWDSMEEMRAFTSSGGHREAMKYSKALSASIVITSLETGEIPSWKEARALLKRGGKVHQFNKSN